MTKTFSKVALFLVLMWSLVPASYARGGGECLGGPAPQIFFVCGHIHRDEITNIGDVLYCNCGDWVESCTALVEHEDGSLEILHRSDTVPSERLAAAA